MTTNDRYRPIACAVHSELEQLVMHSFRGWVYWLGHAGETACEGRLLDLRVRDGVEYLVLDTSGGRCEVRLDRLRQIVDPAGRVCWRQKTDTQEAGDVTG
ncbi:transcriptional antiterminator, Rof [endosymbiont of unidentified scaly snail isolate Monju]|uniref:transcriptional antiterminator, Rof n=1 Tax=endosymbiont of unidentified scaly snail isolate Monju TaxID=1248727 RepID=UPI00149445CB|nr:transcriptional antiterminator, Rof [endosymbiont of unidentified scaly snail isolate Monju]